MGGDRPVEEIRAWLEADIANAWVAVSFRELGIGPQELRASRLGEQVSVGRLSVDDAARTILGPRAASGLDQLRATFRSQHLQLQQAVLAGRIGDSRLAPRRDGPAGNAEGGRRDLADDQGPSIGALLNPDAPRPDQELEYRIGRWIHRLLGGARAEVQALPGAERAAFSEVTLAAWWARLPAAERAWVTAFPDENLATYWDRAVQRALRGDPFDPIRNHGRGEAATLLTEIDRRVTRRAQAVAANPPGYIVNWLGPRPAAGDDTGMWEVLVREIEQYRLLTATTDPTLPLGPTPPPDASWQQCWHQELAQDLAEACFARMVYQHRIVGTPHERQQLAVLAASTIDPWLGVRPEAGIVEASQSLATGELRRRVAVAVPLLADRPDNRASELRDAQLRHARLLGHRQQARAALAAAETRYAEAPLAGRGARVARKGARAAMQQHKQALATLDSQLADAGWELTRLEQAQAAYYEWCRQHALEVTQGQAAAQALQAREHQLLEELATYPPSYLLAELGQPPTNPEGRGAWRCGAQAIERYRAAHQVTDANEAFGEAFLTHVERRGCGDPAGQRRDQARTRELVEHARQAITDSLARELHQRLPGLDQDPPRWAIGA